MNRYIVRYFLPILVQVLNTMTPLFRESIINALIDLKEKATKTPNPVDDIVIMLLLDILDIPNMANSYEDRKDL